MATFAREAPDAATSAPALLGYVPRSSLRARDPSVSVRRGLASAADLPAAAGEEGRPRL